MTDWTDYRRKPVKLDHEWFRAEQEEFNPILPLVVAVLLIGVAFIGAIDGMIR